MLNKLKKQNTDGFTIIEVTIVLAIAAIILLVVLLAVPALQRNSRNSQRRSEAGRVAAEISNYVSNNGGTLPTTAPNLTSVLTSVGTLQQLTTTTGAQLTTGTGAMTGGRFNVQTLAANQAAPTIAQTAGNALELDINGTCGAGGAVTFANNSRSAVLLYTLESGGANYTIVCESAS